MKYFFLFLLLCFFSPLLYAQQTDTVKLPVDSAALKSAAAKKKKETDTVKLHSPRKATIRSAILPGWGQAYNKKYWKIPIVYGALGTAAGFFILNVREYTDARNAYKYKVDTFPSNDVLIKPKFRPVDPEGIRQYRNGVRQNVDYSVLAFFILWGLNVVDATVDGHLKAFEVNENLSLRVNPSYLPQTRQAQIGLVFTFGKFRNTAGR
ncbi:MAG: hypothetical protein K2Q24_00410 [Chitinophagaceae bacterium]|jgi:hypothetical protein|nr:hypothetical protein [Chitinophagaceae bacterium]